jgi:hypothetical protein
LIKRRYRRKVVEQCENSGRVIGRYSTISHAHEEAAKHWHACPLSRLHFRGLIRSEAFDRLSARFDAAACPRQRLPFTFTNGTMALGREIIDPLSDAEDF